MPHTKKYRVDTDKGSYEVEVEDNSPPAQPSARPLTPASDAHPISDAEPGAFDRITSALSHAAHPQSVGDFLSLIVPSGVGEAVGLAKDYGRVAKQAVSESPTLRGIPGQAMRILKDRPKTIQDFQARGFNAQPLAQQMENLPEVPAPPRIMGEPPPKIGVPEPTSRPLYQQVNEPIGRPDPITTRGGGNPAPRPATLMENHEGMFGPPEHTQDFSSSAPTLEEQLLGADQQGKQMAQDTPWNGDPVEEALDRSATRRQESFTDRVNGSDTPDESVVNYTSPGGEPDPNAILGDTMPLGKPRVKTWKSGAGPSDELIGSLRDEEGSKSAARRLAIPQKQVLERAPRTGARQLPPEAQGRITDAMAGMTPEEKLIYLASAPNGLSQDFIKSLMEP